MPSPVPTRTTTPTTPLTWGAACDAVLIGKRVTREGWADPETCVLLHAGALHLRKADGSLHTLIVSEGDMNAADWTIVREN